MSLCLKNVFNISIKKRFNFTDELIVIRLIWHNYTDYIDGDIIRNINLPLPNSNIKY